MLCRLITDNNTVRFGLLRWFQAPLFPGQAQGLSDRQVFGTGLLVGLRLQLGWEQGWGWGWDLASPARLFCWLVSSPSPLCTLHGPFLPPLLPASPRREADNFKLTTPPLPLSNCTRTPFLCLYNSWYGENTRLNSQIPKPKTQNRIAELGCTTPTVGYVGAWRGDSLGPRTEHTAGRGRGGKGTPPSPSLSPAPVRTKRHLPPGRPVAARSWRA